MTRAESGEIRLDGKTVRFRSNGEAIAAGVAYVPEDRLTPGLVQPQSIADNTVLTVLDRLAVGGLLSLRKKSALVDARVAELGIRLGSTDDPVATLSGGNRQRVVLAEGLAILLISDEVPEVWFNCDRVLHMAEGRIVAEFDPREGSLDALERAVHA